MEKHVGQTEGAAAKTSAAAPPNPETLDRDRRDQDHSGQQHPGAPASTGQELSDRDQLLLRALAKARYHEDREAFLGAATRWLNFLVLVLGTSAFAGLTASRHNQWIIDLLGGGESPWAKWAAFATALIGSVQLVFDFPGLMRTHMFQRRIATEICAEVFTPHADIPTLNNRLIRSGVDDPPTYHAVEALAYNAAQCTLGRPEETLLHIPLLDRRLRNFLRFSGGYKTPKELEEEKAAREAAKFRRKRTQ